MLPVSLSDHSDRALAPPRAVQGRQPGAGTAERSGAALIHIRPDSAVDQTRDQIRAFRILLADLAPILEFEATSMHPFRISRALCCWADRVRFQAACVQRLQQPVNQPGRHRLGAEQAVGQCEDVARRQVAQVTLVHLGRQAERADQRLDRPQSPAVRLLDGEEPRAPPRGRPRSPGGHQHKVEGIRPR